MENFKYEKNGITIIALVITIIILLILAGVTIGTLGGKNGVINNAKKMSETEQQKQENSQLQISEMEEKLATSEDTLTMSKAELKTWINQIVDSKLTANNLNIYPIGSIYISTSNTNPSEFIGGTWESYGEGRTLIGAGTGTDSNSNSITFAANEVGGEYLHTLTTSEIPSHTHTRGTMNIYGVLHGVLGGGNAAYPWGFMPGTYGAFRVDQTETSYNAYGGEYSAPSGNTAYFNAADGWTGETSSVGKDTPFNITQPYIVTYMYKRIS